MADVTSEGDPMRLSVSVLLATMLFASPVSTGATFQTRTRASLWYRGMPAEAAASRLASMPSVRPGFPR